MHQRLWRIRCGLIEKMLERSSSSSSSSSSNSTVSYATLSYSEFCTSDELKKALQVIEEKQNGAAALGPFQCINDQGQLVEYVYSPASSRPPATTQSAGGFWYTDDEQDDLQTVQQTQKWATRPVKELLQLPSQQEAKNRWRLRTTMMEMLRDRGYTLLPLLCWPDLKEGDFYGATSAEQLENYMTLFALDEHQKPVVALYRTDMKTPVVRSILAKNQGEFAAAKLILVSKTIVPQVQTFIEGLRRLDASAQQAVDVSFFEADMLVENPKHHIWQPVFRLLSASEIHALGARRKISLLNTMEETDVMARYYGAKPGAVFEVLTDYPHIGEGVEYCRVIGKKNDKQKTLNKVPLKAREVMGQELLGTVAAGRPNPAPPATKMDTCSSTITTTTTKKVQAVVPAAGDGRVAVSAFDLRAKEEETAALDALRRSLFGGVLNSSSSGF